MSSDRPVRLALLGLGFMGSTHLKALRSLHGVRLAAVFSNDERQLSGDLTGVQGNFGGPGEMHDFSEVRKYREVEPLLADPEIDAVDICLPTDFHAETALAALRAGKHVLVEKPMALDGRAADRMAEEAERQGRTLMTAQVLRFWPEYVALREVVRDGQWGGMRAANFRRRCAAPGWGGWLNDPARSGGGVFDLLIHDVDICLHLFGPPEAVSATGHMEPSAGIDVLSAQLFYSDGRAVTVAGGWHHPGGFPFLMEYTATSDNGTVDWSSNRGGPTLYSADGNTRVLELREQDAYAAEIAYFLECCATGRAAELCPPRESAAAVKTMLLLIESRKRKGERLLCRI